MLPSSGRSVGVKSITALPANKSLILADSRYRTVAEPTESVYDFTCDLSGTGIYAKELYYNLLQWNQPLFSHTNATCELRFQMNGDAATTYIVYATPFLAFVDYDGNPDGTSYLTPQLGSYAYMMELGLNGDVRNYPNNTTKVNGNGILQDPLGNPIVMRFRYTPTKGFCIYPVQNLAAYPAGYSIKLLPSTYISQAHFVHGFGIFSPPVVEFTPRDTFLSVYYSDATPTLLPTRYIVIQSAELNKDRRLISFHNGNFANFVNELAIFSINKDHTCAFHTELARTDSTVISLRDDYTPQRFRISISDEYGHILTCSDPIDNMISGGYVLPTTIDSFITTNRGSTFFMDTLIFGKGRIPDSIPASYQQNVYYNAGTPYPASSYGASIVFQATTMFGWNPSGISLPLIVLQGTAPSLAIQRASGLSLLNRGGIGNYFLWDPLVNPQPAVACGAFGPTITPVYGPGSHIYFYGLYMIDVYTGKTIGCAPLLAPNLLSIGVEVVPNSPTTLLRFNPSFSLPNNKLREVFFVLGGWFEASSGITSLTVSNFGNPPTYAPYNFTFANPNNTSNAQFGYTPPLITNEYPWGDPLADGKCEETIHEITAVLEYN